MCFLNPIPVLQARAGGEFVNSDFMELARQGGQAQGPGEKPGCLLVSLEVSTYSPSVYWTAWTLFGEIPLP